MNKQIRTLGVSSAVLCVALGLLCTHATAQQSVNLADNLYGIANPGTAVTGGGADGFGDAYAADLLGPSLSWSDETFKFAAPGPGSAVVAKVIPVPAGRYVTVSLLATGVDGNQVNQTFLITYTDGSQTSFKQSVSDWHTPQSYPGESIAKNMSYTILPNGGKRFGSYNLYRYAFGLDSSKSVQSLTLPNNRKVVVLAVDVKQAAYALTGIPAGLTAADNVYGIANDGTAVTGGGADGFGDAYSAAQLGSSLAWSGYTFTFGSPGPASAVAGKTLALPAGNYASLSLLAAGVDGNQVDQTFIVTYGDGSHASFKRSVSDWRTPQNYPDESIAKTTTYKIQRDGSKHFGAYQVYGYTFGLDSSKSAQSLTLPGNNHVVVLAVDVTPAAPTAISTVVSLNAADNIYGIAHPGTAVTGGGADGFGDAYASDQLGASLSWSGETFTFGAPGPTSGAAGKTVALPAGRYVSLSLLAAGVTGNQANQQFIVTYADGSKVSYTQSVSDWHTPQSYPGESIAKTTNYKIQPDGSKHFGKYYLYGYTFDLDSAKTVQSLTLPTNRDVVVLALDVNAAPTVATPQFNLPSGTYIGQQNIAIADSTGGAAIYYATGGFTPTTADTRYTSPIGLFGFPNFSSTTTIEAIAVAPGFKDSAVASATYTINLPTAATPGFSPAAGIYAPYIFGTWSPQSVTLSDTTPGARIDYSIDAPCFSPLDPICQPTFTASNNAPVTVPLPVGSEDRVNAKAVAYNFNDSVIGSFVYHIPAFPSDLFPGGNNFLFNNYQEQDGCHYYLNIGAVQGCGPGGSLIGPIKLQDWLGNIYAPLRTGGLEASAMFVNGIDLDLTRDHHAVWNKNQGGSNKSAAYVCNYPGPDFYHSIPSHFGPPLPAVDEAIGQAKNGLVKQLACVAIDYGVIPNGMRFLVFDRDGKLLSELDLDGQGPKQIPNACSACHGVPDRANVPASSYQTAGASYIPFDVNNLFFSSSGPGLTFQDQETQIRDLNNIVLNGQNPQQPTSGLYQLIHGWYGADLTADLRSSPPNYAWAPPTIPNNQNDAFAYGVFAAFCRSCHVSNGVQFAGFPTQTHTDLLTVLADSNICAPQPTDMTPPTPNGKVKAIMPNARVTFDRFWTTHLGPSASTDTDLAPFLASFLNAATCNLPTYQSYPNQIF